MNNNCDQTNPSMEFLKQKRKLENEVYSFGYGLTIREESNNCSEKSDTDDKKYETSRKGYNRDDIGKKSYRSKSSDSWGIKSNDLKMRESKNDYSNKENDFYKAESNYNKQNNYTNNHKNYNKYNKNRDNKDVSSTCYSKSSFNKQIQNNYNNRKKDNPKFNKFQNPNKNTQPHQNKSVYSKTFKANNPIKDTSNGNDWKLLNQYKNKPWNLKYFNPGEEISQVSIGNKMKNFYSLTSELLYNHHSMHYLIYYIILQKKINQKYCAKPSNCIVLTLYPESKEVIDYNETFFINLFNKIKDVEFAFKKYSAQALSNFRNYMTPKSTVKNANTLMCSYERMIEKFMGLSKHNECIFFMEENQVVIEFKTSVMDDIENFKKLETQLNQLSNLAISKNKIIESINVYGEKIILGVNIVLNQDSPDFSADIEENSFVILKIMKNQKDTFKEQCNCFVNLNDVREINPYNFSYEYEFICENTFKAFKVFIEDKLNLHYKNKITLFEFYQG